VHKFQKGRPAGIVLMLAFERRRPLWRSVAAPDPNLLGLSAHFVLKIISSTGISASGSTSKQAAISLIRGGREAFRLSGVKYARYNRGHRWRAATTEIDHPRECAVNEPSPPSSSRFARSRRAATGVLAVLLAGIVWMIWPSLREIVVPRHHLALAGVCYEAGDWPEAVAACREAIWLNPELFEAQSLLVQCYLRSHQPDKAEGEFQLLLRFYPASRDVWQQWYERQKQAEPGDAGSSTTGEH
jgi:tetratricopeptide (TPR) repeat protein